MATKKRGRPTVYRAEYAQQAYKLCLLGYTDKDLAAFFGVSAPTIDTWKAIHKDFLGSVNAGKVISDAEVAERFFVRAKGYDFDEVTYEKIIVDKDGQDDEDEMKVDMWKKKIVTKHLPPDAGAALNWLKNRQKKLWRDKIEHGLTDEDGKDVITMFQLPDNGRNANNQTPAGISDQGS